MASNASVSSPRVVFAPVASLAEHAALEGDSRVLLLCTPARRHTGAVVSALGEGCAVFDGARAHVPRDVVAVAEAAVDAHRATVIVAVGGGSAVGLGKALRLSRDVRFVAVPTTYAGSERTPIYGITEAGKKTTGRDARVRPDVILYDPELTVGLPVGASVAGLFNALAHCASALSADSLEGDARGGALSLVGALVRAAEEVVLFPDSIDVRARAQRAAGEAGDILATGKMGAQHEAAHLLGGRFDLEHASTHAVLLPSFLAWLRQTQPGLAAELDEAAPLRDLEGDLYDLLERAGLPVSLRELGVDRAELDEALAGQSAVPSELVWSAYSGVRPSARARAFEPGGLEAGPPLPEARRVVLAFHGRGADAGRFLRDVRALLGHAPDVTVCALHGGELEAALARAEAAWRHVSAGRDPEDVVLVGFSQGACLALELVARLPAAPGGVVALAGARVGREDEWSSELDLAGVPMLLGASERDPWVRVDDVTRAAAFFEAAGADVELLVEPGDAHEMSARQRARARPILTGASAGAGPRGFGNALESEALDGALPREQNGPRRVPYGLFAEHISATGFTARREENRRVWLYRVRPRCDVRGAEPVDHPTLGAGFRGRAPAVDLLGFRPRHAPEGAADFVDGLVTVGGAGDPLLRRGYAVHTYAATKSMEHRAVCNADGDLLLVPQTGFLTLRTEAGLLDVGPGEIAVVPRGMLFSVHLWEPFARGYVAESFGRSFRLPQRGLIGANGLADERHFRAPAAWYEDRLDPGFEVLTRLGGALTRQTQDHSPYDVAAWHGNHLPFVYDLMRFSPVGNVRMDHGDPSMHTVLSAPMDEEGASTLDLVVFVPRWDPTENTFRPPYFHRNVTTEINGIVRDPSLSGTIFAPGMLFITPSFTGHGVAARAVERHLALSDEAANRPTRGSDRSLWFQFETALPFSMTPWAEASPHRIRDWSARWGVQTVRFPGS